MSAGVGNSVGKSYAPQRVPKTDVQKPNSNNNTTSSGSASTGNANASSNAATRDTRAGDLVDISRDSSSRQQAAPTHPPAIAGEFESGVRQCGAAQRASGPQATSCRGCSQREANWT